MAMRRSLSQRRSSKATGAMVIASASALERLEDRWMLSTASFDYTNFGTTSGISYNSYGVLAKTSGTSLVLTDGHTNEDRSAIYDSLVPISNFTTHFTYQANASDTSGDGFTFVIDTGSPTDVGTFGLNLGYGGGTFGRHTYDLAFNTYNNSNYQETFAFASAGATPVPQVPAAEVDLHSGDAFNGTITYDGTTLAVTLVDATNGDTFSTSEQINLTHTLNADSAYVGFTGATGDAVSSQLISNWDFTGTNPETGPSITTAAYSSPSTVTSAKAHLSVGAVSSDGGALTYSWHTEHVPSGAKTPKFSTPGAASTIVQYYKSGTYTFQVAVTDSSGQTVTSTVQAVVTQTPVATITPKSASLKPKKKQQYTVTTVDQFGQKLRTAPTITYSLGTHPSGTKVSSTGLLTAGSTKGKYLLDVDIDGVVTAVSGTVT